jgi:uncharacterized protein (TIGR03435 family)
LLDPYLFAIIEEIRIFTMTLLAFTKKLLILFIFLPLAIIANAQIQPQKPMAPDANPSFEAATIKLNNSGTVGISNRVNGRTFSTRNTTLMYLIAFAYRLNANQVIGAPTWLDKDTYDVDAVQDGDGFPSDKQWRIMLQKLLVDRLKLTFHHDQRELSVFVLTVAKTGPKNLAQTQSTRPLPGFGFQPQPGGVMVDAHNSTIAEFTNMILQGELLDRPVLDQTGLAEKFDFHLTFMPDESMFHGHPPPTQPSDNAAPTLFTAIQEQLGLKLDSTRAPADVIIIDHVEKPSAN